MYAKLEHRVIFSTIFSLANNPALRLATASLILPALCPSAIPDYHR